MKWTNPGHQLDTLGEAYLKVKHLYLFGIDEKAKKTYDFLCWLGVEKDFDISFVLDITVLNKTEERHFCGRPVIAFQTDLCNQVKKAPEESVIALPWIAQINEKKILEELGAAHIFYLLPSHNRRDNFIQNFLCVWLMYRHGKLLSHWTNFLTTSKCNLNCKHCLNFNEFICEPKDIAFEEFKENIDILFSKFDYLYSLHFCGGEPLVVKDLPKLIRYVRDNYGDRVFEFFIITNGTIVPNEETISAVKSVHGSFLIDDYSDTVSVAKVEKICTVLDEQNVSYVVNKAESWFDLDLENADYSGFSEEELEAHKDSCNSYLQEFGEKRFYACCYQQYAHRAGVAPIDEQDYIDLENSSKMEILEFRQGYCKNGYTSMCKNCRGIGHTAKFVAPAVQVLKRTEMDQMGRAAQEPKQGDLVSICVPIYNTAKYLTRCIKSLLAQTYQNIEVVLVDDGSTDNSLLICQEYALMDPRVVVVHKENGGEASARNVGLSAAKGEYVMFIDSDDEYLPNAVELLVRGLTQQQADLAIGGYLERCGEVEHFSTGHLRKYTVKQFADIYLHSNCNYDLPYIATTVNAKLFKRAILQQHCIQFDERFVIGNDAMFMCSYLEHINTISDIFEPIYIYYKFNASERVQGMGWYYPDTFFLFAYVADRMICLSQPPEEQYRSLVIKQYKDLLYAMLNASANLGHLEHGLLPYVTALDEEVQLFRIGAKLDLEEHCIHREAGALPFRLISYLIVNRRYEILCSLLLCLSKTRDMRPYQGDFVRQMIRLQPILTPASAQTEGNRGTKDFDGESNFDEDGLLAEEIDELVESAMSSRQLVEDYARKMAEAEARTAESAAKASEAEIRANGAEARAAEAEARVAEAETRANGAEAKAAEAETKTVEAEARANGAEASADEAKARANQAEARAYEAEARASAAESRANGMEARAGEAELMAERYRAAYESIIQSHSWKFTKLFRIVMKPFRKE